MIKAVSRTLLTRGQRSGINLAAWTHWHRERTGTTPAGQKLYEYWEVAIIRRLYPDIDAIRQALPHRSSKSLSSKVNELGIPAAFGRSRIKASPQRLRILRRMYETLDMTALKAVAGAKAQNILKTGERHKWQRPRRPFVATGNLDIDNLLRRCFAARVRLVDLDEWINADGYFARKLFRHRTKVDLSLIRRAHKVLADYEAVLRG